MKNGLILSSILIFYSVSFGNDTASYETRKLTPGAEKRAAEIQKNNSIRNDCFKKYGQEITDKTGALRTQIQGYFFQEREIIKQKSANDSVLIKIQSEIQSVIKDTARLNTAEKSARLLPLKKERDAEERKIHNDPDVLLVHDNYVRTRERINQIIREIIKDESECVSCMSIGTEQ